MLLQLLWVEIFCCFQCYCPASPLNSEGGGELGGRQPKWQQSCLSMANCTGQAWDEVAGGNPTSKSVSWKSVGIEERNERDQ